jgi:hypothetical protein
MNQPEGNGEAEEVWQPNKGKSDLAITRIAQMSALLKYFLQRASAIPPYFPYQLKDAERFIGMLNDMWSTTRYILKLLVRSGSRTQWLL